MSEPAVPTLASGPAADCSDPEIEETSTLRVNFSIDQDLGVLASFNNSLQSGGRVDFGSSVGPIRVRFLEASPLVGLEESFDVGMGSSVTTVVAEDVVGRFPFELDQLEAGGGVEQTFGGLEIDVVDKAEPGTVSRIGFRVGCDKILRLQTFAKPEEQSIMGVFTNRSAAVQCVESVTREGGSKILEVPAGQTVVDSYQPSPNQYGTMAQLALVDCPNLGDSSGDSYSVGDPGGVQHADIIVEPPP